MIPQEDKQAEQIGNYLKKDYIVISHLKELKLSHYGQHNFLVVKKHQENHLNVQILMVEAVRLFDKFLQNVKIHMQIILDYYQKKLGVMNLEGEMEEKPAYLQIHAIYDMPELVNKKQYLLVLREGLQDAKLLSTEILPKQSRLVGLDHMQKDKIAIDLAKTLAFLHSKGKSFGYGQVTPFNILISNDQNTVKIVDTYFDQYLRSVEGQNFKATPLTTLRDAFCRVDYLKERNSHHNFPTAEEDIWGECLTLFTLFTGELFFEEGKEKQEDLENTISTFASMSQYQRKYHIEGKVKKMDIDSDLLWQALRSFENPKPNIEELAELSRSIGKVVLKKTTSAQVAVDKDKTLEIISKIIEKQKQDDKKPDWKIDTTTTMTEGKFVEQQKVKTEETLNEYIRRVIFMVYGQRVKWTETSGDGIVTGEVLILRPNGETNKQQHKQGLDVFRGKAYMEPTLKESQLNKQFVALDVFFRKDGLNPISPVETVKKSKQMAYISNTNKQQVKIKAEYVLGFAKKDVEHMATKFTEMKKISKQYRKKLYDKTSQMSQLYSHETRLHLFQYDVKCVNKVEPFMIDIIPILSIHFFNNLRELSMSNNKIINDDVKMMVDNNFYVFRQLIIIDLSYNFIDDKGLMMLLEASRKKQKPYFRNLKVLKLRKNKIKTAHAFKLKHRMDSLEFIDLSDNQLDYPVDFENLFRMIPNKQLINMAGNPFVQKMTVSDEPTMRAYKVMVGVEELMKIMETSAQEEVEPIAELTLTRSFQTGDNPAAPQ